MRLGLLLELPTQRENVELARRAEAAGFDSAWAPEFHNHSGVLALAAAALETERIELGDRDRLGLRALAAADGGDRARPGRDVGRAVRARARDRHAPDATALARRAGRAARRPACARRSRRCARCGSVRPGRRGRATTASWCSSTCGRTAAPGQVRDDIPVYVAAVNEGMARTAGAVADGVVAHPMATPRYIDEVMRPALAQGAEQAGRPDATVAVADWVIAAVSDDARAGARGREAPDRLPRDGADVRPDPRPARVRRPSRRRSGSCGGASTSPG